MRQLLTALSLLLIIPYSVSGQVEILGTVMDRDGKILIGANIIEKGTENGTVSSIDGTFSLLTSSDTLIVSYLGYKQKEVILKGNDQYRIILIEDMIRDYYHKPIEIHAQFILVEKENITTLPKSITEIAPPGNTNEILNTIPGLHMQSGGYNTNKLSIRGIGSTSQFSTSNVKTFYNNIPLHNSIGESAIEDLGLHMAERIEVIKGTTGSEYEAGFGGAIIIKNKNIRSEKKTEILTNNTIGKWGHFTTQNSINIGRTNKVNSHNFSLYHLLTSDDGYRENNQFDRNNLTVNYTINKIGKLKLTGLLNRVDLKAFIPSSLNKEDYDNDPSKAAFTWNKSKGNEEYNRTLAGLNLDYNFDHKRSTSHTVYGHFFESSELRPFNTIDESASTYGIKGTFQYNRPGYDEVYTVGYRLQKEGYDFQLFDTDTDVKGAQFGDGNEQRSIYEIYAKIDGEISEKWSYNLGINTQYANILADDNDVLAKAFILPEAIFTYKVNYSNRVYLNIGRGINYYNPQQALLPNGQYSKNLLPTSAWNIAFGSKGILVKKLQYRVEVYTILASDLITIERDGTNQPINTNGGSATYAGLELAMRYSLMNSKIKCLAIDLQYNVMNNRYHDYNNDGIDYSNNIIPGTPTQTVSTILTGNYKGWFANARCQYVNSYNMRDDNTIKSDSYQLINVMAGYKWNLGKWQISPRIDIANLLNQKYASMTLVNASSFGGSPPRYYYSGRPLHGLISVNVKYSI